MQYEKPSLTPPSFVNRNRTVTAKLCLADYFALVSCCLIIMLLYRVITYIWIEGWQLPDTTGALLIYALRWDAKLLASWGIFLFIILGPWLLIKKTAHGASVLLQRLNIFLLLIVCISSHLLSIYWDAIGYPFDNFMFGIVHDETTEILAIIWNDYHPLKNLAIIFFVCSCCIWFQRRLRISFMSIAKQWQSRPALFFFCLTLPILLVLLARGSISLFPLSKKTTHFSSDNFNNELAINAPNHLYYALKENDKNDLNEDPHIHLHQAGYRDIKQATNDLLFSGENTQYGVPLLKKSQAQFEGNKPNMIFIMMESWSSHILFKNNKTNDFLGSFKNQQQQGALFTQHLSTRLGTSRFIESTLLNTSLLDISISRAQKMRFKHSNLQPLIANGYHIYFVSGGARSWLNHDNFWKKQGVTKYWDMLDIMKRYQVKKHSDWGVHDEYTLAFAQEKAAELTKRGQPFFMFVITTSNHPPHRTPQNYQVPPFDVSVFNQENQIKPEKIEQQLATFRYSTDQLGIFLANMTKSGLDKTTLIAATGDHILRGFYQYNQNNEQALAGAVPFYIQAPAYLMKGRQWNPDLPSSHRDIFPTLFELALPNAEYLKTGFNLLDENEFHGGWHEHDIWITKDEVSFADGNNSYQIKRNLRTDIQQPMSETMQRYRRHTQALEALLEWQVRQEFQHYRTTPKTNKKNALNKAQVNPTDLKEKNISALPKE